ncbi:MAG: ATP-binding cassette domain-containing protein, partial [Oceanospirillaceae bacterium]|nr:ATP-binding cassette domain-containing protein [Oceanospirillaceae bacterium]
MSASPLSPEYIKIRHAHRQFITPEGGIINALDDISLSIAQSEFITLLGPSGCGKTTLLKIVAGFEELDSGDILLDGQSIIQQPAHKRPVNTVFQSYALFPHMTVGDNVGYGLDIAKVNKIERNQRVAEALNMVGLSGIEQRLPSQLSGGQQQRVALARAIINRPKLLLLDEPLSALDKNLRLQMQLELKNLQSELGICFIFVTHD